MLFFWENASFHVNKSVTQEKKKIPPKKLRTVVRSFARKLHARKRRNISSCTQKQPSPFLFAPGERAGRKVRRVHSPYHYPPTPQQKQLGSLLSLHSSNINNGKPRRGSQCTLPLFLAKKTALADFPFKDGKDQKIIQKNDAEPLYPPLPWQGAERRGRQGHPSPEGRAAFPRHDEVRAGES